MMTASQEFPPTEGEPGVRVDKESEAESVAQHEADEREELEHLYSIFEPASMAASGSLRQDRPRWEDPAWVARIKARRQAMGGQLFFDRLLDLAGIKDFELYPPTSQPMLHTLLDRVHLTPLFDKAKKDSLVFYLLLALYPVEGFPSPQSPSSDREQAAGSLAFSQNVRQLKQIRARSRAYRFASLELLSSSLTRPIKAYFLLDSGLFLEASSFMDDGEIEPTFVKSILEVMLRAPADYSGPDSAPESRMPTWPYGAYRAKALSHTVEALNLDLLANWRAVLQEFALEASDEAGVREDTQTELSACEDSLVGYSEAIAFEKGAWIAWESIVEALPAVGEQVINALGLDLDKEDEAQVADRVFVSTTRLRERLGRIVWEHCFYPAPRPAAVKQMLEVPFSSASWDLLNKLVLSPSRSLTLPLQATAADVLLVRYVQEGRYVDALRLDALLDATSVGSASAGVHEVAMRGVLVEKRKRLLQGVQALLPVVQKKLLDLELGFIEEADDEDAESQDKEQAASRNGLQMSWENVFPPTSAAHGLSLDELSSSKAAPTKKSHQPSRPLSASPLLRQSPYNGSDPQMAVLTAVVRSSVSPSQKPSEAFRRRARLSGGDDASHDKQLSGFLARNRPSQTPTRSAMSVTPDTTAADITSVLNARSPFVAPPNVAPAPVSSGASLDIGQDEPSWWGMGSEAPSVFSATPGSLFEAPRRRYEARYSDTGASPPAGAPSTRQSPGLRLTPDYRKRFQGADNTASPGFGTDASMIEDEIIPLAPSKSRIAINQKQIPSSHPQIRPKEPSPGPASPPVRRRFGLSARAIRGGVDDSSSSRPAPSALRSEVNMQVDHDDDDVANKTIPGGFPGLSERAEDEAGTQAMEGEQRPAAKRKHSSRSQATQEAESTNKTPRKAGVRASRSAAAIAASTPRRRTRQLTVELESQAGSDGEEAQPSTHMEPPISSTPLQQARKSGRTRRKQATSDPELDSVSEATQTGDDEDGEDQERDAVGELVPSTSGGNVRRSGRNAAGRGASSRVVTSTKRRSARLSTVSPERELGETPQDAKEEGAEDTVHERPRRRGASTGRRTRTQK
ncbi:hypothetical protein K437DRAFT_296575 [Tilletiaria anomala UBC 951]|uniref:ELYS-like domain-containing protein n=1 Tax=Tilletiaria anomala (strain ATCC 24038 / CBS 436.72 / UBC 951) TaxID=1037660 RepID=A0A066VF93_TILAU|nr:uncharacterized protein K437DRAFT_296575 [Tilletiaria anomala UBC 951]KDN37419.1 hypothetical protein K437DRAFT_296575 [Tilletiaria anomala UBC 951]